MQTVIFVSPHSDLYGAEKSLISMMLYVRKNGYKPVLLIKRAGPIESLLRQEQLEYHIVPFRQCINVNGKPNYVRGIKDYIRDKQTLSKFIAEHKQLCEETVLVHTNSVISWFGVMLANRICVPHIQHIREFGKEDFDMEFNFGNKITALIFNKSSKIVCISDAVYNTYCDIFDPEKMVRIYNGIGTLSCVQPERKSKEKNKIKIILVGRLSKEKGQREAITACEKLLEKDINNFELHLYGNGVDEGALREYVKTNHLENYVYFEGYKSYINYSDYDIALMTSKAEAFGRVTVEYMLNSLPVVGFASGGTTEIVLDKETGLLSELGDIEQLSKNVQILLLNEKYRTELGEKGRKRANELFTEEAYGQNIIALYADVLNKK